MTEMNPEIKARWTAALRSGKYKQTQGKLRIDNSDGTSSYCCLGVLCELAVADGVTTVRTVTDLFDTKAYDDPNDTFRGYKTGVLPAAVIAWSGINYANPFVKDGAGRGTTLSDLNDHQNYDFHMIADAIDRSL